ncbi:MAG TPA: MFS transporter [Jatrophihabitans sp.]|jgi:EmrB/QacA subfamily drug resistance transporter
MERKWWTLLVVCAATFMLLLDVTIVIVALPDIQQALHSSFSDVQWVTDAYALTLAALLLTSGSLADRFGRKRLFLIGLGVFTGGSLLCAVAANPLMLILSRAVQGVGGAVLFSTAIALLAMNFQGRERGVAFGIWGAVTGVSTALGPILGGVITSGISWRGIFWVNLPVGIAAILVTLWKVAESRAPHTHRPDFAGFATLTAGLVALVYGLIRASESSWSDDGVIICLILAVVLLAGFVVLEAKVEHPMFDLSLLRIPTFLGGSVAAFAMNGSLYAMLLYLVIYLQNDLGYSALQAGLRIIIISGSTMVVATIAGRISAHFPARWLIGPGLILVGVGLLLMSGLNGSSAWTHLIPGFILGGVGGGMVNPPLASTAVGVVHHFKAGMASGVNNTFRQIGMAVGIAAYGSIFTARLASELHDRLAGVPEFAGKSGQIADAVHKGAGKQLLAQTPAGPLHDSLAAAMRGAFAASLNTLVIVAGIVGILGGVAALSLIRAKDFVHTVPEPATEDAAANTNTEAAVA